MQKASLKENLLNLPTEKRKELIADLDERQAIALLHDWEFWARDKQLPPEDEDWSTWLILAGRGFGKTRTGAEQVRRWVNQGVRRIALVAQTPGDARDTMIEGESGLLNVYPPGYAPHYEPSKRRVSWPNGAKATIFSGHQPDQLRGPQHEKAWVDELAAFDYPQDTWDNLMFGLRLGGNPQAVVTTTPRPIPVIKDLIEQDDCYVVRGSSYENKGNLSPKFFKQIISKYEGTRLGEQEIYAELLTDSPGALWSYDMFQYEREVPPLVQVVVAIDPATTSGEGSDETGIIVAGRDADFNGWVLADLACRKSPNGWATVVKRAYDNYEADLIVGEVNQGGDMVESVVKNISRNLPFEKVRASRGKQIRAQPVSMLYEQGRVFHKKNFKKLEDQLTTWTPGDSDSPDRLDALVWGLTKLLLDDDTGVVNIGRA